MQGRAGKMHILLHSSFVLPHTAILRHSFTGEGRSYETTTEFFTKAASAAAATAECSPGGVEDGFAKPPMVGEGQKSSPP